MNTNKFWIARTNPSKFRYFARDKNARSSIEGLNLLRAGKSLSEIWETVFLPLYQGDEGDEIQEQSKPIPDFSEGIFGLAISKKAHTILLPLIESQTIFLELPTEAGLYYELDIQKINCLDVENSKAVLFPNGGILRVEKYSFYWDKLANSHIFCIPEIGRWYPVFISKLFKEVVDQNNLTGLTFHPVPLVDGER